MKYIYFYNIRKELKKLEFLDGGVDLTVLSNQRRLRDTIYKETKAIPMSVVLTCLDGGKK